MNKKNLCLIILSFVAVCSVTAFFESSEYHSLSASNLHSSSCDWSHYQEIHPTYESHGVKEYWICCSHSHLGPVFSKPETGKITNRTHPSDFSQTITKDDDRYLKPYSEPLEFSDSYLPSIFSINSNARELQVTSTGELKFVVTNGSYGFYLDRHYLDEVFSDSSVSAIAFDLKGSVATNNLRRHYFDPKTNAWTNGTYELNNSGYGMETNWKTFTYTRDFYSLYKEGEIFVVGGNVSDGDYIMIDNIRPVFDDIHYYGFENGKIDAKKVMSPGHSDNRYTFYEESKTIFSVNDNNANIFKSASYDYDFKTEGNRSLKITKTNGYMALYLLNTIKNMMGDDDIILIDILSNVLVNSNADVRNMTDGMNRVSLCPDGAHPANKWVTYTFNKSQITDDGRFLILQGSTAGDFNFDNVRIAKNCGIRNDGVIDMAAGQSYSFTTTHNVDSIDTIFFNNVEISPSDATVSINGKTVTINSDLFTEGKVDEIQIVYKNNHVLYTDIRYFEIKQYQNQSAINLSVNYGDSGYYTLKNYSNVYRMTANGREVPFEVDGSNYLIPNAALVELVPTVNNAKTSGTVNLYVHSLNGNKCIPLNITVNNGSSLKSMPNYNGEGIKTHAYSFSSEHSASHTANSYLGTDNIAEYENSGLDIIYEQKWHVTTSATKLSNELKLLLDNAHRMGKKVILSDDVFSILSKSINTITDGSTIQSVTFDYSVTNTFNMTFASESALDTYVESRLKIYINHPACYGVSIGDEQMYDHLLGGFKDLMASLRRVLTKIGREDFYLNVNLHPLQASEEILVGRGSTNTGSTHEEKYYNYLNKYLELSGNDYVQFDAYPFADDGKGGIYEGKGLNYYYLQNLIVAAQFAKDKNIELKMVGQSVTYYGTRVLDRKDIAFINNMMLGMGVKHISFFVYCVRGLSGVDNEGWIANSSFLLRDGQRNTLYYYYQSQLNEINDFAPIISNFDYEWIQLYKKNNYIINKPNSSALYTNAQDSKYYSQSSTYGEFKSASVSRDWCLVTGLKSKTDNANLYMIQNLYNSFSSELLQECTLTFSSTKSYAVIYESGLPRVVNMNSNKLTVKLSSGRAAYVFVY